MDLDNNRAIYDLIVIGGGPAGYLAAERAGKSGLSTLLFEKASLGGVCLNDGCIPTKTLLYSAKLYDGAVHGKKFGVYVEKAVLNHEAVIERKNKVVRALNAGVKGKLKKSNVTVVAEQAVIAGRNEDGFNVKAGGAFYTGRNLLIATGSVPAIPPIKGISEGMERGFVLTNREILDLKEVPRSLAVIGGGIIGLEMASYFNSAGSKVTVIEMLDRIAPNADREISDRLMKNYQKKGVEFLLGARVTEIGEAEVICEYNGQTLTIPSDKVLVSTGRRPATEGLGLENIGVEADRGAIITDEYGRTNVQGVYAAGDVNGKSMLAHTAYREAEVCVDNILGNNSAMRYDAVASVIYTNPEVAFVGETEETARENGIDFEVLKLPMTYSGRYVAENEYGDGFCKVLIDRNGKRIIGVHMIGSYSSEIIYGAAMMVERKMTADDLKEVIFPHPTVSEIIKETIFM